VETVGRRQRAAVDGLPTFERVQCPPGAFERSVQLLLIDRRDGGVTEEGVIRAAPADWLACFPDG